MNEFGKTHYQAENISLNSHKHINQRMLIFLAHRKPLQTVWFLYALLTQWGLRQWERSNYCCTHHWFIIIFTFNSY